MALTVNTNLSALQAYNSLSRTSASMANSMAKLSSGLRINTAADDAAGLTISEGLKAQVNGYGIAARNAQDGINMIQTADGAMGEVHSILQRMRDLAVQGANDSNNTDSRTAITKEAGDLSRELYRIAEGTNFNGIDLLKGGTKAFQVGAGGTANDTISVTLATAATDTGTLASADGTAAGAGFDVTTNTAAQTTITAIDTASRPSRRAARVSVPCRTASTTRSTSRTSRRRTSRRRSRTSPTPTWRRRWSTTRRPTSCPRPARRCSPRPTSPARASSSCSAEPFSSSTGA